MQDGCAVFGYGGGDLTSNEKEAFFFMNQHRYRIEQEQIPRTYVLQRVKEQMQKEEAKV